MEEDNQPVQTPEEKQEGLILLRDQNKLLEKRIELMEVEKGLLDGMYGTTAERLRFEERIQETRIEQEEILLALAREGDKEAKDRLETLRQQGEKTKAVSDLVEQIGNKQKQIDEKTSEIAEKRTRLEKLQASKSLKARAYAAKELKKLKETEQQMNNQLNKLEVELLGIRRASVKVLQDTNRELSDLVRRIPGYDAFEGLTDFMKVMRGDGLGAAMTTLLPKGINAAISAFNSIKDSVLSYDDALVKLNRTVGAYSQISNELSSLEATRALNFLVDYNVTSGDMMTLAADLASQNAAFAGMFQAARNSSEDGLSSLSKLTYLANSAGITATQQAEYLDIASNLMGKNLSEATEDMMNFTKKSKEAGLAQNELLSVYNKNYPQLRIYGHKAEGIFNNLSRKMFKLGLDMDFALNLSKPFDTYEKAAKTTTELNLLLGANFDSLRMMASDPEEIFNEIRKNITPAKLSRMGKFTRSAVSDLLGISFPELEKAVRRGKLPEYVGKTAVEQRHGLISLNERMAKSLQYLEETVGKYFANELGLAGAFQGLTMQELATGKASAQNLGSQFSGEMYLPPEERERYRDLTPVEQIAKQTFDNKMGIILQASANNEQRFVKAFVQANSLQQAELLGKVDKKFRDDLKYLLGEFKDSQASDASVQALARFFKDNTLKVVLEN